MKKLTNILILIIFISSCEKIELSEPPCYHVFEIGWNVKDYPIIKVPIINAQDYYEVKAMLFNDLGIDYLMEKVTVKKDTIILNAVNVDLTYYQDDKQICEIWLRYTK